MAFEDVSSERVRGHVRTMQIICGMLAAGVVTFLVIVLVINGPPDAAVQPDVITYVSIGFFLVILMAALIVPGAMLKGQLAQIAGGTWKPPAQLPPEHDVSSESAKLLMAYQMHMIVRLAMFEGAGFFGLVAYLVEGHWLALGVAICALALLLSRFPTRSRLENWAESAQRRMQEIRQWPKRS